METIILFAPLLGALLAGLTWRVITDAGAQWASTGLVSLAALLSWVLWINFDGDVRQIVLLDWLRSGTLDAPIAARMDAISLEMMVIVLSLSALSHIYALGFMERDKAFDEGRSFRPRFFAYLSLFTFAMLILVTADNLLQLILGLQLSGVMAYLLISFRAHYKNANAAAIKSFIFGGLGHGALMLGVAGLYLLTDSLALDVLFDALMNGPEGSARIGLPVLELCAALIFLGAMAASAQLLLHVWLPDAMEAPAPAAALLSALYALTGAFVLWRLAPLFALAPTVSGIMVWVGALTALLGAMVACAQTDIKRAMGFFASAQLGVIFATLGLGLGSQTQSVAGVQIPLFAVVQAMLVLCVGAVTRAMDDSRDIAGFGALRRKMPAVALAMAFAAVVATGFGVTQASVGVLAPESGNQLFAAAASNKAVFWVLCGAAGLGVLAIWRLVFLSFNGTSRAPETVFDAVKQGPTVMVFALSLLAVLMLGFVIWELNALSALPGVAAPAWVSQSPLIAALAGFGLALCFYILQPSLPKQLVSAMPALHGLLLNGFHIDRFYGAVVVSPLKSTGDVLSETADARVVDGTCAHVAARVAPTYAQIANRRFGAVLLSCATIVFFGLVAVISWLVLSGGQS